MSNVITGLFSNPDDALAAINELAAKGVSARDVTVIASESTVSDSFGVDSHSKLAEGTAIGATSGGAIGAIIAGFTTVGAIASGGAGLLVAGPIVAALAGAGAGAAAGGAIGALAGLGFKEHEIKFYEDALEEGSVLLGVEEDAADKVDVEKIFKRHDAKSVSNA